jgi:hypothetical protein
VPVSIGEDASTARSLDVTDRYAKELEQKGGFHPMPYLGVSPVEAAVCGIWENLQMRRDPTWGTEIDPDGSLDL